MATIIKQPANNSGKIGENVYFSVSASGSSLTYKWQYSTNNGSSWTDSTMTGYKTDTMTVAVTAAINNYLYRCIVTDSSGSVTSSSAKLTVDIDITQQPVNCTVVPNGTANFSVTATGVGLTYAWYYSYKSSTNNKYTLAKSSTTNKYSLTANDTTNECRVYCIIKDSNGNSVQTNTAVLIVGTPVNWVSQLNVNGREYAISSKEKVTNIGIFLDKNAWVYDSTTNLYKYTVIVIGLTEGSYCELGLAYSGATPTTEEMKNFELIAGAKTSYNTLEIYAEAIPEIDMVIVIKDDMASGDSTIIDDYSNLVKKINSANDMANKCINSIDYSVLEQIIGGNTIGGNVLYKKTIMYQNNSNIGKSSGTVDVKIPHGINTNGLTDAQFNVLKTELETDGFIFPYMNYDGSIYTFTGLVKYDLENITLRSINTVWNAGRTWYITLYYTTNIAYRRE